jgi:malonyl CoA-acyl carrier protein transacylase
VQYSLILKYVLSAVPADALAISHQPIMTSMARRLALVFPGQGSQRVGMGADLLELWPRVVGDVLDEASEAARLNLRRVMLDGPSDRLALTAVAQPALLAHSISVLRVLQVNRLPLRVVGA